MKPSTEALSSGHADAAPDTPGLADIARLCGDQMPLPVVTGAPGAEVVFSAPWQAHAFAMTVQLHEKGVFTWPQWAAALSAEIRRAQTESAPDDAPDDGQDDGSRYYTHWLNALEQLVIARQIGSADQIHALEHAWEDAAARTPHGQPIVLEPSEIIINS